MRIRISVCKQKYKVSRQKRMEAHIQLINYCKSTLIKRTQGD